MFQIAFKKLPCHKQIFSTLFLQLLLELKGICFNLSLAEIKNRFSDLYQRQRNLSINQAINQSINRSISEHNYSSQQYTDSQSKLYK